MPTLQRFHHCRIVIYYDDHPPPHVHIKLRDGRDCTVDLETLAIGGLVHERDIHEALNWIRSNQISLLKTWRDYHQ